MFTNDDAAQAGISQNELPTRHRNPEPADRRPTILTRSVPPARTMFGGWGPRLG